MGIGVDLDQANALLNARKFPEAIEVLSKIVAKRPREARALHMLGVAHAQRGQQASAEAFLKRATDAAPRSAAVLTDFATLLAMTGRAKDALPLLEKALRLEPNLEQAAFYRGVALTNAGRLDEALAAFDELISRSPGTQIYHFNRASVLVKLDRINEAERIADQFLLTQPMLTPMLLVKCIALADKRCHHEAMAVCDRILAREPDNAEARYNRGHLKLLLGDLAGGFADHESRLNRPAHPDPSPAPHIPRWQGEPIEGRSLLVYCEQGFGDTLHFCRYLSGLAASGADVTLHAPRPIVALLRTLSGKVRVVDQIDQSATFAYQIALLSLPLHLGTVLSDIPNAVPYLSAQPDRVTRWQQAIGDGEFKIGIAWQGNPQAEFDKSRSVALREFLPLSQIPGVRLISLQKNSGIEQINALPPEMKVDTLGAEFDAGDDAFLDTAAVMQHLDLVIAPNTAIAHLAGALARPVLIPLDFNSDWRWFLERTDSPWYPSAKLFRQQTRGDWGTVFADIADDVRSRLA
jgi:tetratricopeptide (TPR) repeat protein